MTEADFYLKIADLLGVEYFYSPPLGKKTRWNNRDPGNGRFPGRGLVRRYNSTFIHVHLFKPAMIGIYTSEDAVLDKIKLLCDQITR